MEKFSSKLALNQALLVKNNLFNPDDIVLVKTRKTPFGQREDKYLLKKCDKCGKLFSQIKSSKKLYLRCDSCVKKGVYL